jgi:hypothetical protein
MARSDPDPRAARLKAALKANMGRRKAQARARAVAEDAETEAPPPPVPEEDS